VFTDRAKVPISSFRAEVFPSDEIVRSPLASRPANAEVEMRGAAICRVKNSAAPREKAVETKSRIQVVVEARLAAVTPAS
jgi:hypothetical protein